MILLEALLTLVIPVNNPLTVHRWTIMGTWSMRLLIGSITLDDTLAAGVWDWHIVTGRMGDAAPCRCPAGRRP